MQTDKKIPTLLTPEGVKNFMSVVNLAAYGIDPYGDK